MPDRDDKAPMPTSPSDPIAREVRTTRRGRRIGCALAVVFLALATWLVMRDDPMPEDADLLLILPESAPGVVTLLDRLFAIGAELPEPEPLELIVDPSSQGGFPWVPRSLDRSFWGAPAILERMAEHCEATSPALDRLHSALESRANGWRVPASYEAPMPEIHLQVKIWQCLLNRALWHRARGDVAAASRDVALLLHFSKAFLEGGSVSMLHSRKALGCVGSAWGTICTLLYDGDLDPSVERNVIERSAWIERIPSSRVQALRGEYTLFAHGLDELVEEMPWWSQSFVKINRTRARFGEMIRANLADLDLLPLDRRTSEMILNPAGVTRRTLTTANMGEQILLLVLPDGRARDFADRALLEARAGRTLVALRRYEREHGPLPPDLAALVAAFPALESVPVDPYSGAPLRYDPARRILWSVGEDGVDGNGDGWEELRDDPEAGRFGLPDWVWPIAPVPGG